MFSDWESSLTELSSDEDVYVPVPSKKKAPPKGKGKTKTKDDYKVDHLLRPYRTTTYTARSLYDQIVDNIIELDPEYQRDVVWTETKQVGLIDSLFRNFYIPPVIFAVKTHDDGSETRTCIDGKQRLTSIQLFMDGLIPHKDIATNRKYWYRASGDEKRILLPKPLIQAFGNKQIVCVEYDELDDDQEREIFQRVQLGVALTTAERMQAIPGPWPALIREVQSLVLGDEGFGEDLDWGHDRGRDFSCLATIINLIDTYPSTIFPGAARLETWLSSLKPVPAKTREIVLETFRIFIALVKDKKYNTAFSKPSRVSPIEFTMTGMLIFKYRNNYSLMQLSSAIWLMRADVRRHHKDIRSNSTVAKTMFKFINSGLDRHNIASDGKGDVCAATAIKARMGGSKHAPPPSSRDKRRRPEELESSESEQEVAPRKRPSLSQSASTRTLAKAAAASTSASTSLAKTKTTATKMSTAKTPTTKKAAVAKASTSRAVEKAPVKDTPTRAIKSTAAAAAAAAAKTVPQPPPTTVSSPGSSAAPKPSTGRTTTRTTRTSTLAAAASLAPPPPAEPTPVKSSPRTSAVPPPSAPASVSTSAPASASTSAPAPAHAPVPAPENGTTIVKREPETEDRMDEDSPGPVGQGSVAATSGQGNISGVKSDAMQVDGPSQSLSATTSNVNTASAPPKVPAIITNVSYFPPVGTRIPPRSATAAVSPADLALQNSVEQLLTKHGLTCASASPSPFGASSSGMASHSSATPPVTAGIAGVHISTPQPGPPPPAPGLPPPPPPPPALPSPSTYGSLTGSTDGPAPPRGAYDRRDPPSAPRSERERERLRRQDSDWDMDRGRDRDRSRDRHGYRAPSRGRERERDKGKGRDRGRDWDKGRDRDRYYEREQSREHRKHR